MATEPGPNDVAVALGSLLTGAGAGGALLSLTVLLVRQAQVGTPAGAAPTSPSGTATLAMGSIGALVLAAGVAFARASVFGTRWQRVAVAAIAAFATVIPGLAAVPLEGALGPVGLIALAASCATLAWVGWRFGR